MAERRMFAKTIVLSDAFLDMPLSARCLYFTLGMLADDDGFVNSPKAIMRQVGASEDDLKLLGVKKFVIFFSDGVLVIKHWRIHNYIQSDRYVPTKYQDHKDELTLDENKSYTFSDEPLEIEEKQPLSPARQKRLDAMKESDLPYSFAYKMRLAFIGEKCPICGATMGTANREDDEPVIVRSPMPTIQHNIPISLGGKHELDNISVICAKCNASIQDNPTGELNNDLVKAKWEEINRECIGNVYTGKDSIDKNSIDTLSSNDEENVIKVAELWNQMASKNGLSLVSKLTNPRKSSIKARVKEWQIEGIEKALSLIEKSDFLLGKKGTWKCNFDWFINPTNFTKIMEGTYTNSRKSGFSNFNERNTDLMKEVFK